FPRQALHAATLGFRHPRTGEEMRFSAPLPEDMAFLLGALRNA
ncbi:MAG: RNA pseudouridine synthase, partial [Alphaproteobacteria bacterium]|nr:RNA pseudouridine synthase [Alphaproteobacteria bacterium]MDX5369785.1 RNA pseudouridine synthase [Alphaproteobacteria bacterium]MDX5464409.1 RNA pseudouridine synthase [Alphaproteobacteria bacterium]